MFENYVMSEQQLREMALNAMLLAVDAQTAAIKSMDREHSLGIENSFSAERLRAQVKDMLQSTHELVKATASQELPETRDRIKALAAIASKIKGDADRFKASSQPRAKSRYAQLLLQTGMDQWQSDSAPATEDHVNTAPGKAPTSIEVSCDARKLSSQAGFACLRAELDEYEAFSMQIHAICNLALEYALNAAAKAARHNANI